MKLKDDKKLYKLILTVNYTNNSGSADNKPVRL